VAAVILQLARAEGGSLEPGKLLAPFIWVALPAMAMTAAVAVLFETLPVLRGGVGNVIYFFAWSTYLGLSGVTGVNDYLGFGFFMRRMVGALKLIDPSYNGGFALQVGPLAHATKTFLWNGVDWTPQVLLAACNGSRSPLESRGCPRCSSTASIRRARAGAKNKESPEPAEERMVTPTAPSGPVHLTPLKRTPAAANSRAWWSPNCA
jgi:hypothetical protein